MDVHENVGLSTNPRINFVFLTGQTPTLSQNNKHKMHKTYFVPFMLS